MVHPNEQKYFVKQTQYIKQYGFIIKKKTDKLYLIQQPIIFTCHLDGS